MCMWNFTQQQQRSMCTGRAPNMQYGKYLVWWLVVKFKSTKSNKGKPMFLERVRSYTPWSKVKT